jgi:hypothetical protein
MAPLNLIYRKIDKKTGASIDLDDSNEVRGINQSLRLQNLINNPRTSHAEHKKSLFPEINKSHIFGDNSIPHLNRSKNFFTSKLRASINKQVYQPLVPIQPKKIAPGGQFFRTPVGGQQREQNPVRERPLAFGVDLSQDKRDSSIDSNSLSDPTKTKKDNSSSNRSDSINKNQNGPYVQQPGKELYRINNKYNGKADRVSLSKDIYQILSIDIKNTIMKNVKDFIRGENVKDEQVKNFVKLFVNGLYYAYNQPSWLKVRFQPNPITIPNENKEGKKTLFIEPFYVFAVLEDH